MISPSAVDERHCRLSSNVNLVDLKQSSCKQENHEHAYPATACVWRLCFGSAERLDAGRQGDWYARERFAQVLLLESCGAEKRVGDDQRILHRRARMLIACLFDGEVESSQERLRSAWQLSERKHASDGAEYDITAEAVPLFVSRHCTYRDRFESFDELLADANDCCRPTDHEGVHAWNMPDTVRSPQRKRAETIMRPPRTKHPAQHRAHPRRERSEHHKR